MITTLTDEDVRALTTPATAVAAMRAALLAAHRGELAAPPRVSAPLGDGRLVVTAGAWHDRWYGYRTYDTRDTAHDEQVVVLHDAAEGTVAGIAVGSLLGQYRTGALGGVATDALARPDAGTLGVIGTGAQAFAQVWAIQAVRDLTRVTVYGRDERRRRAFAARLRDELGLTALPAGSAREAVEGHAIVVLATSSRTPVVEAAWIAPGAAVTTLGPKRVGAAEFDASLAERAALLVSDSPAQTRAYEPPFVLAGTPAVDRLVGLGALLAAPDTYAPAPEAVRLYCSVGLAGSEVALLAALLGR